MFRHSYNKIVSVLGLYTISSTVKCIEEINDVRTDYTKSEEKSIKSVTFSPQNYVWSDAKKCERVNTSQQKFICKESLEDYTEYIKTQIKIENIENLNKVNFDTAASTKFNYFQIEDYLMTRIELELEKAGLLKTDFLKIMELCKKIKNKNKLNVSMTTFMQSKINLSVDEFIWYYENLSHKPNTDEMDKLIISVINKELEKKDLSKTDFLKLMEFGKKVKMAISTMDLILLSFMQKKINLKIDEFYWYYENLCRKSTSISNIMTDLLETHIINENKGKLLDKKKYTKYSIPNYDGLISKIIKNNPDIQTYEAIMDKINAEIINKKIGYFRSFICDSPDKFKEFQSFINSSSSGASAELKTEYARCHSFNSYYHYNLHRSFKSLRIFFTNLHKHKPTENLIYDKTSEKFFELIMGVGSTPYFDKKPKKEKPLVEFIVNNKIGFRLEYIEKMKDYNTFLFLLNKLTKNEVFVQNYIPNKIETHADLSTHNFVKSNHVCLTKLLIHFMKLQGNSFLNFYSKHENIIINMDIKSKIQVYDELKNTLATEVMSKYIIELHKLDKPMYKHVASDTVLINKLDLSSLINTLNKFT